MQQRNHRDDRAVMVLQITDLHVLAEAEDTLAGVNTEQCFHDVLALAQENHWPPDLILFTGDLAQDPCRANYTRLLRTFNGLGPPCICLPGNHDDTGLMAEILNDGRVSCQSQTLIGDWQILCLDSKTPGGDGGHLADDQLETLARHLSAYPREHALIVLHHHCVPTGSRWLDEMVLDNRREFFEIIDRHPQVRGIVCGHIHQSMDTRYGNIRVLGTPSTCFQFKPLSDNFALDASAPGYRWLALDPDGKIDTGVVRLDAMPAGLNLSTSGY